MMNNPEGVSAKFNLETYLEARKVAKRIALLFAAQVDEGITEEGGFHLLDELFKAQGVENKWHPHKFRIGSDTTKVFREKSDKSLKLKKDDIYFIDIGPVVNGHEADYAQTFTIGQNIDYANIQKESKRIFDECLSFWQKDSPTGKELYSYAEELAHKAGYILKNQEGGHRLGDFPHALFYKGRLSNFEKVPVENLWVLEIHLNNKDETFGAFYEDILFRDL
jgi:Xaa-Pro aminopeptidase